MAQYQRVSSNQIIEYNGDGSITSHFSDGSFAIVASDGTPIRHGSDPSGWALAVQQVGGAGAPAPRRTGGKDRLGFSLPAAGYGSAVTWTSNGSAHRSYPDGGYRTYGLDGSAASYLPDGSRGSWSAAPGAFSVPVSKRQLTDGPNANIQYMNQPTFSSSAPAQSGWYSSTGTIPGYMYAYLRSNNKELGLIPNGSNSQVVKTANGGRQWHLYNISPSGSLSFQGTYGSVPGTPPPPNAARNGVPSQLNPPPGYATSYGVRSPSGYPLPTAGYNSTLTYGPSGAQYFAVQVFADGSFRKFGDDGSARNYKTNGAAGAAMNSGTFGVPVDPSQLGPGVQVLNAPPTAAPTSLTAAVFGSPNYYPAAAPAPGYYPAAPPAPVYVQQAPAPVYVQQAPAQAPVYVQAPQAPAPVYVQAPPSYAVDPSGTGQLVPVGYDPSSGVPTIPGMPAYDPTNAALYTGAAYGAEAVAQQAAAQAAQAPASGIPAGYTIDPSGTGQFVPIGYAVDPSTGQAVPANMLGMSTSTDVLTSSLMMGAGGLGLGGDFSGDTSGLDPSTLAFLSGGDPNAALAMAMGNGGFDPTGGLGFAGDGY